jgi:hypothetical protein
MATGMPGFALNQTPPIECTAHPPGQRLLATHQHTPSIGTPHPSGTSLTDGCTVHAWRLRPMRGLVGGQRRYCPVRYCLRVALVIVFHVRTRSAASLASDREAMHSFSRSSFR